MQQPVSAGEAANPSPRAAGTTHEPVTPSSLTHDAQKKQVLDRRVPRDSFHVRAPPPGVTDRAHQGFPARVPAADDHRMIGPANALPCAGKVVERTED